MINVVRVAVAIGLTAISILVTSFLMERSAFVASAVMALPITFVGWRHGRWYGLLTAALAAPTLFQVVALSGGDTSAFSAFGFGPGFLGLAGLGLLVGYAGERTRASLQATKIAELARDALALVASDLPLDRTLDQLVVRIETDVPEGLCSILLLNREEGTLHHASAPSLPDAYCQAIDGVAIGPAVGSCGTAAFRNELVIVENIQRDPLWADFSELAAEHGLQACWSMPIRTANGDVEGTFAVYYEHPRTPHVWELELVRAAVADIQIVLARHRDRERQKQFEERVQAAEKLEGLGLLAGGIAHDLNNLLMSVLGNAELLEPRLTDEVQRNAAGDIIRAASTAAGLAGQVLMYAGEGTRQLVEVELSRMVSELLPLATAGMPKTVRIELDLADNLPPLSADVTQLRQVLMNLLVNAADAIGDRVGTVHVRTCCKETTREDLDQALLGNDLRPGLHLCLSVEDDGDGMSEDLKKHIFDPFFSTKSSGRGLGLAVTFGVVRRHNGAILLDSQPGQGTRFTILLPVQGPGPDPTTAAETSLCHESVVSGVALVIDDEPAVRSVLKRYLKVLGFGEVHEASGGLAGVQAFRSRSQEISLVMIDLTMPDINGRQVLREISSLPSAARFVLMTGYDASGDDSDEISVPILQKPFDLKTLSRVLGISYGQAD